MRNPHRLLVYLFAAGALMAADRCEDFVQITDTHINDYAKADAKVIESTKAKAGSAAAIERFFAGLKANSQAKFVLLTGDIVDRFEVKGADGGFFRGQLEYAHPRLAKCPVPLYLVLGNHDVSTAKPNADVAEEARKQWSKNERSFRRGNYYAFDRKLGATRYRIVVLDNSLNRAPEKAPYLATQLTWLKGELAAHKAQPVIVSLHIPLGKDELSTAIKSALATHPRVLMTIAGHRHSNGIEEVDLAGKPLAQVRTAAFYSDEKNVRRFRLCSDRVEVYATQRPAELEKKIAVPAR